MWRDWFYYSKRERNGIIVLLIILLIVLFFRIFFPGFPKHTPYDYSEYQARIDSFKQALRQDSINYVRLYEDHFSDSLFRFNPNTLDSTGLRQLGFGIETINNIKKFRQSGGSFKDAEDLLRIYSLTDSEFTIIEPYVYIPSEENLAVVSRPEPIRKKKLVHETKPEIELALIELNSADTAELKKLYGIGDVLSERIIKFRELLGGFCEKDQLMEVYGMTPETYAAIKPRIKIDTALIQKLDINLLYVNQLKKHPYLNFYQAKAIYDYRIKHGSIENFEDILQISDIDTVGLRRVKPYLRY